MSVLMGLFGCEEAVSVSVCAHRWLSATGMAVLYTNIPRRLEEIVLVLGSGLRTWYRRNAASLCICDYVRLVSIPFVKSSLAH